MERPPDDIIYNILLRLPIKSLIRCKDVCMAWCNIVESPRFIKDHFTQSTQNQPLNNIVFVNYKIFPNEIEFNSFSLDFNCGMGSSASVVPTSMDLDLVMDMDSLGDQTSFYGGRKVSNPCNGLLCVTEACFSGYAWIYNPATREYLTLPKETNCGGPTQLLPYVISGGLGLDEATGVYKIVRLSTNGNRHPMRPYEVRMLTIGEDSWRSLGWFTDPVHLPFTDMCPITFAGGALHWLSESKYDNMELISLNVGNEIFSVTQLPNFEGLMGHNCLREWMGFISLWRVGGLQSDIWVLKDSKSWTKQCTIEFESRSGRHLVPMGVLSDDEILLLDNYQPFESRHIASYNIKSKKITMHVQIDKFFSHLMPLTSSLVSIKAATKVSLT